MRKLYQLYDLTAEAILGVIISEKHDGPAVRTFNTILSDKNTLPGQFPDHFVLLELGIQDEATGIIDPLEKPRVVATGTAWLEANKPRETQPEMFALPMGASR